jgi:uncharacterized membrane protein YjjP (DUF1212 family)
MDVTQILIDQLRSNRWLRLLGWLIFGLIFAFLISATLIVIGIRYLLTPIM